MKLMRYTLVCLLSLLLVSAAACGAQNATTTPTPPPTPIASTVPTGDGQVFTGTIDEVKDFMLTATDETDTSYVFGNEGLAEGTLDDIKVGDQVRITYTGDLSDIDSKLEITAIEKVA